MTPLPPPREVLQTRSSFRSFRVSAISCQYDAGASSPYSKPPSEKQLAYAQTLALRLKVQLPDMAATDSYECSSFIDSMLSRVPPTDKQKAYALSLAQQQGLMLEDSELESAAGCSEAIDRLRSGPSSSYSSYGSAPASTAAVSRTMYTQGPGEPSQKQIDFAISLAKKSKLGLPYEVMSEKEACTQFIDQLLKNPSGDATAGDATAGESAESTLSVLGGAAAVATNGQEAPEVSSNPVFEDENIPF